MKPLLFLNFTLTHDTKADLILFVLAVFVLVITFWRPKAGSSRASKISLNDLKLKLKDSGNQINQFRHFKNAEAVIGLIDEADLVTLEEYTKETRSTWEERLPGVCEKYNALIEEIKKAQFNDARLKEIIEEAWKVTHP